MEIDQLCQFGQSGTYLEAGTLGIPLDAVKSVRITRDGRHWLLAGATLALALAPNAWIAGAVMFAAGLAWIGMLTVLNVAAQMASPGWVKARALAVYLLVFQGAMTGGQHSLGRAGKPLQRHRRPGDLRCRPAADAAARAALADAE